MIKYEPYKKATLVDDNDKVDVVRQRETWVMSEHSSRSCSFLSGDCVDDAINVKRDIRWVSNAKNAGIMTHIHTFQDEMIIHKFEHESSG